MVKISHWLAVGEKINGKWGGGFDGLGQLALIAAICRFDKAGDLRKHQRLEQRGIDFVMCGGQFQSGAELVLPDFDGFQVPAGFGCGDRQSYRQGC